MWYPGKIKVLNWKWMNYKSLDLLRGIIPRWLLHGGSKTCSLEPALMRLDQTPGRLWWPPLLLSEGCTALMWMASFAPYSNHIGYTSSTLVFSIMSYSPDHQNWQVQILLLWWYFEVFMEVLFEGVFPISNVGGWQVSHRMSYTGSTILSLCSLSSVCWWACSKGGHHTFLIFYWVLQQYL